MPAFTHIPGVRYHGDPLSHGKQMRLQLYVTRPIGGCDIQGTRLLKVKGDTSGNNDKLLVW